MRKNYILVDQENVHIQALPPPVVNEAYFYLIVFVGENQTKLAFDLVETIQKMGERAQYVKISGNGANALDFHIAYTIGRLSAVDPAACFHIISKDTGFDPLIRHLIAQKIPIARVDAIPKIALLKPILASSDKERIHAVVSKLSASKASKPARVATLVSTINSWFQKQLTEPELRALVHQIQSQGFIKLSGEKITYALPANE